MVDGLDMQRMKLVTSNPARFASALITASLVAGSVSAQSMPAAAQEVKRATELLQSTDWADKAWGAFLAGRLHSKDLDDRLVDAFRTAASWRDAPSYSGEYGFLAALFDAAILTGVIVPASLLEPFEERWSNPVLILLAGDKDSEDAMMRLAGRKPDILWLAANNLLLHMKSPRWYASTLADLSITHEFIVVDGSSEGFGGGTGGGMCGDRIAAMPQGFPPVAIYNLTDNGERGSVLLAEGPKSVYYKRTIVPTGEQVGFGSCTSILDRAAIQIEYLAQLARVEPGKAREVFHPQTEIHYRGVEAFSAEIEQSMSAQENGIRALIDAIHQRGLDPPSDVRLRIVRVITDRRQNATEALPVVGSREIMLNSGAPIR
jgi:hypothetical protein